jgi:phytoene dehydrogenase-like protein
MRHEVDVLVHFRGSIGEWAEHHLRSETTRRFFTSFLPPEAPAFFLAMQLGYLERGYLSRPVGGSGAFRDALVRTYQRLGGEARLHATVDEILVEGDRACGVRLDDGSTLAADVVVSTSSMPETVLRLLGGRHGAEATHGRLAHWKLFTPIVQASFGVALPFEGLPAMWQLEGLPKRRIGGRDVDRVYVRVCNDDPAHAPAGHCVVQATIETSYEHWAALGAGEAGRRAYADAKDEVASQLLEVLEPYFPGIREATRVRDVATPLTFWRAARSWRGAYEGWIPTREAVFGHVDKTLPGLAGFYMAGQWVEPGGGVPTVVTSGRQVVQLLCEKEGRPFVTRPVDAPDAAAPSVPSSGRTLVLYATREGQTRRIAERIAGALRLRGHEPDVRDARTDAPTSLSGYRGAVLAASVHRGEHEPEMIAFVRRHRSDRYQLFQSWGSPSGSHASTTFSR